MPTLRSLLLLGPVTALAACVTPAILRTGTFPDPVALAAGDPEVVVAGVMAGEAWTHVWVDVQIKAKAADSHVDPNEFSLFVPATGITIPSSQRRILQLCPGFRGPNFCRGARDHSFRSGSADPTPPLDVKAGEKMVMTLLFETGQGAAEEMEELELVFHGQRLKLGADLSAKEQQAREAQAEKAQVEATPLRGSGF
jgi:hypothetical protein